jgi:hypothetical protein
MQTGHQEERKLFQCFNAWKMLPAIAHVVKGIDYQERRAKKTRGPACQRPSNYHQKQEPRVARLVSGLPENMHPCRACHCKVDNLLGWGLANYITRIPQPDGRWLLAGEYGSPIDMSFYIVRDVLLIHWLNRCWSGAATKKGKEKKHSVGDSSGFVFPAALTEPGVAIQVCNQCVSGWIATKRCIPFSFVSRNLFFDLNRNAADILQQEQKATSIQ